MVEKKTFLNITYWVYINTLAAVNKYTQIHIFRGKGVNKLWSMKIIDKNKHARLIQCINTQDDRDTLTQFYSGL